MKKLLLFLPLFFGFGCFGWFCSDTLSRYNVDDIRVELIQIDRVTPIVVGSDFTADSIILQLFLHPAFTASATPSSPLFMNTAYAFSCPDNGHDGMVDGITDIQITSNAPFNEFAPGASLNSIIDIRGEASFADFIRDIPQHSFESAAVTSFIITEKPDQPEHSFLIELTFDSGRILTKETIPIIWN